MVIYSVVALNSWSSYSSAPSVTYETRQRPYSSTEYYDPWTGCVISSSWDSHLQTVTWDSFLHNSSPMATYNGGFVQFSVRIQSALQIKVYPLPGTMQAVSLSKQCEVSEEHLTAHNDTF